MYNIYINPFSITSTVYTVQYIVIIIATVHEHVLQYCQNVILLHSIYLPCNISMNVIYRSDLVELHKPFIVQFVIEFHLYSSLGLASILYFSGLKEL